MYPQYLKYSKDHEWVELDQGLAKVGITSYAQEALGDVVFVELPLEGQAFEVGESFGVVETVKAVADVYLPVGGEVIKVNEKLLDSPELLNEDPYGEGWMVQVKPSNSSDFEHLMDASQYRQFLAEECD